MRAGPCESYLQEARARQATEEFDIVYRLRPAVERKIGELVMHGLRHTRYVGESKRQTQRLWLRAAVNLKRLFILAQAQGVDLRTILGDLGPPRAKLVTMYQARKQQCATIQLATRRFLWSEVYQIGPCRSANCIPDCRTRALIAYRHDGQNWLKSLSDPELLSERSSRFAEVRL